MTTGIEVLIPGGIQPVLRATGSRAVRLAATRRRLPESVTVRGSDSPSR